MVPSIENSVELMCQTQKPGRGALNRVISYDPQLNHRPHQKPSNSMQYTFRYTSAGSFFSSVLVVLLKLWVRNVFSSLPRFFFVGVVMSPHEGILYPLLE